MRKVYNKGGMDFQVSASVPVWKWLQVYGSVEYLEKHGKSLSLGENASIWEIPVSVGLKPVLKIHSMLQGYVAIGPQYFYLHAHNQSSYVDRNITHNGIGGFANMGFNFFPCDHLSIDLFGEYSYRHMNAHSSKKYVYGESAQVGGLSFGGGIGYVF